MLLTALLKGLTIGFLIAAPVGPIGILCIRRTLVQGRWLRTLFSSPPKESNTTDENK